MIKKPFLFLRKPLHTLYLLLVLVLIPVVCISGIYDYFYQDSGVWIYASLLLIMFLLDAYHVRNHTIHDLYNEYLNHGGQK